MKNSLPIFLLAINPHDDSGIYILHNTSPRFIAHVIKHTSEEEQDKYNNSLFEQQKKTGDFLVASKTYLGEDYFTIVVVEFFEDIEGNLKIADKLSEVIQQAADWYIDVLCLDDI